MRRCKAKLSLAIVLAVISTTPSIRFAAAQQVSGIDAALAIQGALAKAIEKSEKSVVAVFQYRSRRGVDHPLQRPFGDPTRLRTPDTDSPDYVPTHFASGVVVNAAGLVLTNYHVLGFDSEDYFVSHFVTTADHKVYRARVKAADPRGDMAVLQLEPGAGKRLDLPTIELGKSETLKKGHFVLTLGNPYGVAQDGQASAGWGIVANLGRRAGWNAADSTGGGIGRPTLHHYGTLIQTDARLNLGASGGPLLNLRGEMIGLTTAAAAQAGYEQSAGYAIPVDDVFRRALDMLMQGREVEYGFLGVQTEHLAAEEMRQGRTGMRIVGVIPGSPAARGQSPAGAADRLMAGDIVTHVNNQPVYDSNGLVLNVGRLEPERLVRLRVLRDGRQREVQTRVAKYPVRGRVVVTERPPAWRGMFVDYPTAVLPLERLDARIPENCVAVSEVVDGSPAAEAGLQRGMLIDRVGDAAVATPDEFRAAAAKLIQGAAKLRKIDSDGGSAVNVSVKSE